MKAILLAFAAELLFLALMLFTSFKWATIVFGTGALLVLLSLAVILTIQRFKHYYATRKDTACASCAAQSH